MPIEIGNLKDRQNIYALVISNLGTYVILDNANIRIDNTTDSKYNHLYLNWFVPVASSD